MTLNKKLAHKTVKAHYIAYRSINDLYLRIDDNRVNTVDLAESYPANLIFWRRTSLTVNRYWHIDLSKIVPWRKPVYMNKSFMEKVASFASRGTKESGVKVTVRSNKKSSSAKHFMTKKPTIRPPRHSKTVANPMVTQAESSSSAREDDNEEYQPPGLGKLTGIFCLIILLDY